MDFISMNRQMDNMISTLESEEGDDENLHRIVGLVVTGLRTCKQNLESLREYQGNADPQTLPTPGPPSNQLRPANEPE